MTNGCLADAVEIETGSLSHLSKIRALWSTSFSTLGYGIEDLESMFFSLDVVCLVAMSSVNLCGFIIFERSTRIVQILGLAVDDGWSRQGIGLALVERCMKIAQTDGSTVLYFHTQVDNVAARKLFERLGFNVERFEGHYPTGERAVRYSWSSRR
jgi:ribosomal protein S18 acetylase RimI-like enzyme